MEEEEEGVISKLSTTEGANDKTLVFLDSLDNYLVLIETLSSTIRQGWLELASARHSMGGSRVNTALLSLKPHSAATTVELDYYDNGDIQGSTTKSPKFSLCKWTSADDKTVLLKNENIKQLDENLSSQDSENEESTLESSKGSETMASPHKTEKHKERAKVLSMFGTLVSPKLCASQLSFETALQTLVEIANTRSSILEAHDALIKDSKNSKE